MINGTRLLNRNLSMITHPSNCQPRRSKSASSVDNYTKNNNPWLRFKDTRSNQKMAPEDGQSNELLSTAY